MKISIRYQLVGLVGGILIAAMLTYLFLATSLFTRDKLAWLYDYNALLAGTLSEEVGTHLRTLADKLRYFGAAQMEAKQGDAQMLFDASEDLLAVELWARGEDGRFERRSQSFDRPRLDELGIDAGDVQSAAKQYPLAPEAALADGARRIFATFYPNKNVRTAAAA